MMNFKVGVCRRIHIKGEVVGRIHECEFMYDHKCTSQPSSWKLNKITLLFVEEKNNW